MSAAPTSDRVGAWARSNANPNYPPAGVARSGSRSAPNSQYAPSSYGGTGSIRRKLTRRTTNRAPSRIQSTYEEEEEGYVSGEYEDGPYELTLIRIKASSYIDLSVHQKVLICVYLSRFITTMIFVA